MRLDGNHCQFARKYELHNERSSNLNLALRMGNIVDISLNTV